MNFNRNCALGTVTGDLVVNNEAKTFLCDFLRMKPFSSILLLLSVAKSA